MKLAAALLLSLALPCSAADPCAGKGTLVLVRTEDHHLHLCENNVSTKQYSVALGTGGVGKRREGDAKTPLGTYSLGAPRASAAGFGTFIPIGYPTPEQRKAGYTGGAVGIHAPPRGWEWAGPLAVGSDWTLGCVAVESDLVIGAIARWVRAQAAPAIHVE